MFGESGSVLVSDYAEKRTVEYEPAPTRCPQCGADVEVEPCFADCDAAQK